MIDDFRNEYYFLSNFYPAPVTYNGLTYLNSEAAYQAQKTLDNREIFTKLTASNAKRLGKHVYLRDDWDNIKDKIMFEIVKEKFLQNNYLKIKLLNTQNEEIVEKNYWNDTYWGTDLNYNGQNKLGKILMSIREMLKD